MDESTFGEMTVDSLVEAAKDSSPAAIAVVYILTGALMKVSETFNLPEAFQAEVDEFVATMEGFAPPLTATKSKAAER